MQFAGQDVKVSDKNKEAVVFKKYSWLIYVFIIAFLLPGNFWCLWGLKIRKPVVTYIIPDKKDPLNQFGIGNERHLMDFHDLDSTLSFCYVGKTKPNIQFALSLSKSENRFPIWNITWNKYDYFDYNGDMIFDLKMPQDNRKDSMFYDGGVWKPCRLVSITGKGEILYNGKPYVFKDGRWREKKEPQAEK